MFGWYVVRVSGHSMSPSLSDGDYALARRVAPRSLVSGDAVLVDHPEFGRIVKRLGVSTPAGFRLHGESPLSTDSDRLGEVAADRVLARLQWRIAPSGLQRLSTGGIAVV